MQIKISPSIKANLWTVSRPGCGGEDFSSRVLSAWFFSVLGHNEGLANGVGWGGDRWGGAPLVN